MKKLITGLFLLACVAAGHSQIVLDEARITSDPTSLKVDPVTGMLVLTIPESHFGEFEEDPLNFVRTRLDIKKFLADNEKEDFAYIEVIFKTNKGRLIAEYDDAGELLSTYMKLKNVPLPDQVRMVILEKHHDARFLSSNHVVTTRGWDVKKDIYRVKIYDGTKNRNLKVNKKAIGYAVTGL